MRIIFFFLFFSLFHQPHFSQKNPDFSLTYRLSIDKKDFFTGIALGCKNHNTISFLSLESGIIRSFFQSRFFPRLGFNTTWIIIENQRFVSGPLFQYSFSTVQLNAFAGKKGRVNYNDLMVGWSLKTNRRFYFKADILAGYHAENSFNTYEFKINTIGTIGYSLASGIGYAF